MRAWFRDVVGGKNMVLCHASALEYLQLFSGYLNENRIDVYAKEAELYENIRYRIVNDFSNLDIVKFGGVQCTSASQTFNDMLRDYKNTDEQALIEGLSEYYYTNNESFDGLIIHSSNIKVFNEIKYHALEYYGKRY